MLIKSDRLVAVPVQPDYTIGVVTLEEFLASPWLAVCDAFRLLSPSLVADLAYAWPDPRGVRSRFWSFRTPKPENYLAPLFSDFEDEWREREQRQRGRALARWTTGGPKQGLLYLSVWDNDSRLSESAVDAIHRLGRILTKQIFDGMKRYTEHLKAKNSSSLASWERSAYPTGVEILRRAAAKLLVQELVSLRPGNRAMYDERVLARFFHTMEAVAAMQLERRPPMGGLAVSATIPRIRLERPVSLLNVEDLRGIRRVVEIAGANEAPRLYGISDNVERLTGLGVSTDDTPEVRVRFCGERVWECDTTLDRRGVFEAGSRYPLFVVRNGVPTVPRAPLTEEEFECWWLEQFTTGPPAGTWDFTKKAVSADHGALLIFSSEASSEARGRLSSQATCVSPVSLRDTLSAGVLDVDGALLVDLAGKLQALGVVLDGDASVQAGEDSLAESRARGSRFNSAVRYVRTRRRRGDMVGALVISEDGGHTFVPTLQTPRDQEDAEVPPVEDVGFDLKEKKAAPKKGTPKKGTPKKATPKKATPKKGTPKKTTPKKATPKKATPKKATPKKGTPKKATPKKATPKKATPKKGTPKKTTPKKATSKKATSKKATPKKATPKKATPKKATPKKT